MEQKRRNLTGIFIENVLVDDVRMTICVADAPENERVNWLTNLDHDRLVFVANVLAKQIRQIGDDLDLSGPDPD